MEVLRHCNACKVSPYVEDLNDFLAQATEKITQQTDSLWNMNTEFVKDVKERKIAGLLTIAEQARIDQSRAVIDHVLPEVELLSAEIESVVCVGNEVDCSIDNGMLCPRLNKVLDGLDPLIKRLMQLSGKEPR